MNKLTQVFALLVMLAAGVLTSRADTFYTLSESALGARKLTNMKVDLEYGELSFTDAFSSGVTGMGINKRQYVVHFYMNNKRVMLAESGFGFYDYVLLDADKAVTEPSGSYTSINNVDRMANIVSDKSYNTENAIRVTKETNTSYTTREIKIKDELEWCKSLGFYDLKIVVEPLYWSADGKYVSYYSGEKGQHLWLSNYVNVSIPVLDVTHTMTLTNPDGSVRETSSSVNGPAYFYVTEDEGEIKTTFASASATYDEKTTYVKPTSVTYKTYRAFEYYTSSKTWSWGGYTQFGTLNTLKLPSTGKVNSTVVTENSIRYSKAAYRGVRNNVAVTAVYKDGMGVEVTQTFSSYMEYRLKSAVNIGEGTNYSFDGKKYFVAENGTKVYRENRENLYVKGLTNDCMPDVEDMVTEKEADGYTKVVNGDVLTVTTLGVELTITTHKDVNVKVIDGVSGATLMNETRACGASVELPLAEAKPGMVFKGYSCEKYEITGNVVVPKEDVTVTMTYEDAVKVTDPSTELKYTLKGNVEVAATKLNLVGNKALRKDAGYGHIGLPVRMVKDAENYVIMISGVDVKPLKALPTEMEETVAEDIKVAVVDGELAIAADEECELSVYQINGVCVEAAKVCGKVRMGLPGKGVYVVVARRGGEVVFAKKVAKL